ncbi:MAG: hypothetical protein ACM3X5_07540 [Bacillota bacterium]
MTSYQFAPLPSNGSVAALVTLIVCAWFTVAVAAMLAEPGVEKPVHLGSTEVRMVSATPAPDAGFRIEVVAKRVTEVAAKPWTVRVS